MKNVLLADAQGKIRFLGITSAFPADDHRNYNRFGAEATITFAPDPLPDDQLKEQEEPAKP